MSRPMRFVVEVTGQAAGWQVSITCPTCPGWERQRLMRQAQDDRGELYPLPLDDDLPPPTAEHHALSTDAEAVAQVYRRITTRRPQAGEIRQFGSYLFHALLGPDIWDDILAQAGDAPVIELALLWTQEELALHRLNWEMMCDPRHTFLAAWPGKAVAITRLVAGTAAFTARQLNTPPRLLFVIGVELTDPQVSPGAEYLGLLRQLEAHSGDCAIHSRVIHRASPARLRQALAHFRPDVVHFISHGQFTQGQSYLVMELDEQEQNEALRRRDVNHLLHHLKMEANGAATYPPILMLSACYSGGAGAQARMAGAHETAPLAAALVAGGIPIVVGMAGRISDLACRLFTRRFGLARVQGEPLVTARAQGRRAAFGEGLSPATSVDWAFPAVFLAQGVAPEYVPTPACAGLAVEEWITGYDIRDKLVFFGRTGAFEHYYHLFEGQGPTVLALAGEKQIGKTRLLQEFTAQAIRDGHLPLLLWSPVPGGQKFPRHPASFGLEILRRLLGLHLQIYGLDEPANSALVRLLAHTGGVDVDALANKFDFDRHIFWTELLKRFEAIENVEAGSIRRAIQHDLAQLRQEAIARHEDFIDPEARLILLLDDVHMYGQFVGTLLEELLGPYGLGTHENPIPVIFTYRPEAATQGYLKTIENKPWLRQFTLQPFSQEEDFLACQAVFLHPFEHSLAPEGWTNDPLTITNDEQIRQDREETWKSVFHLQLDGKPAGFLQPGIYGAAKIALDVDRYLQKANDDQILQHLLEGDE